MRFDYYSDETVALEAFKAGASTSRRIQRKVWATAYDMPAGPRRPADQEEQIPNERPAGMQASSSTSAGRSSRTRVRQALGYAFDFEWTNKTLFFGQYTRTTSYFDNSELAATGLPERGRAQDSRAVSRQVPDQVFTKDYQPPTTDGTGNNRANLRKAFELLQAAGWVVSDGKLVNEATGEPLPLRDPARQAALRAHHPALRAESAAPRHRCALRTVDDSQYRPAHSTFDFDMIVASLASRLSPGNEQRDFWGSAAADQPGSRNYRHQGSR